MIVGVMTIKIKPGYKSQIEKLAVEEHAVKKTMKGFKDEVFFADWENDEIGSLVIWETEKDKDNWQKQRPKDQDELYKEVIKEITSSGLYELIETD